MFYPSLIAFSFFAGVTTAIPSGPIGAILINGTLQRGVRAGYAALAGLILAELAYVALFASGVHRALLGMPVPLLAFRVVGGGLLLWMGVRAVLDGRLALAPNAPPPPPFSHHDSASASARLFGSALLVGLADMALIFILDAIVSAAERAFPGASHGGALWLVLLCNELGAACWFVFLILAASRFRHRLVGRRAGQLDVVGGALLAVFGLWTWFQAAAAACSG